MNESPRPPYPGCISVIITFIAGWIIGMPLVIYIEKFLGIDYRIFGFIGYLIWLLLVIFIFAWWTVKFHFSEIK